MIEAASGGFLIAVLWMDLIFDTQVLRHRETGELPEPVLASIAGYYHRATTTSRPMSYLIAAVMLLLLGALAFRALSGGPGWLLAVAGALAAGPILLALFRTVPHAVTLGNRTGNPVAQTSLARAIFYDHIVCLVSISAFLLLWVAAGS